MQTAAPSHVELYGRVALTKAHCPRCRRQVIVIDGHFACCGESATVQPEAIKRASEGDYRRRRLSKSFRTAQLKAQQYRCAYCEHPFGSAVYRKTKAIVLRIEWDHVTPYAYSQNNHQSNFLAVCQVCNALKHDLYFQTIDEVKTYVQSRRREKGYRDSDLESHLPALPELPATISTQKTGEQVLLQPLPDAAPLADNPCTNQPTDNHLGGGPTARFERKLPTPSHQDRADQGYSQIWENPHSQIFLADGFTKFINTFGLSLGKFASHSGVSKATLSRLVNGVSITSASQTLRIADGIERQLASADMLSQAGYWLKTVFSTAQTTQTASTIKRTQNITLPAGAHIRYVFKDVNGNELAAIELRG